MSDLFFCVFIFLKTAGYIAETNEKFGPFVRRDVDYLIQGGDTGRKMKFQGGTG